MSHNSLKSQPGSSKKKTDPKGAKPNDRRSIPRSGRRAGRHAHISEGVDGNEPLFAEGGTRRRGDVLEHRRKNHKAIRQVINNLPADLVVTIRELDALELLLSSL